MTRAEVDYIEPQTPTVGSAEAVTNDADHGAHVFLYVPDISMETGWSTHRVPEREPERLDRRPVGFRR